MCGFALGFGPKVGWVILSKSGWRSATMGSRALRNGEKNRNPKDVGVGVCHEVKLGSCSVCGKWFVLLLKNGALQLDPVLCMGENRKCCPFSLCEKLVVRVVRWSERILRKLSRNRGGCSGCSSPDGRFPKLLRIEFKAVRSQRSPSVDGLFGRSPLFSVSLRFDFTFTLT